MKKTSKMSRILNYLFYLTLIIDKYNLNETDCKQKAILCNLNNQLSKERVRDIKVYDVRLSVYCCEEWFWIKCMERAVRLSATQYCESEKDFLDEKRKNLTKSKKCQDFKRDSLKCAWPFWLHIIILMAIITLIIGFIGLSIFASQTKPINPKMISPEEMAGTNETMSTTFMVNEFPKSVSQYYTKQTQK